MSLPNVLVANRAVAPASKASASISSLDQVSTVKHGCEEGCGSDLVDKEEGQEQLAFAWVRLLLGTRKSTRHDLDAVATRRSAFDDHHLAPFYWPKKGYENIHRFDPSARWSYREEKALVRKIDWRIMVMVVLGFFALNLDRSNITQANSASFLSDLHLTTDDFNLANTIFRVAYICSELPSQLMSKRLGPDRWIPIQICLWSIVSLTQFWLSSKTTFLLCRALLGLVQGGFLPELVLYMSYFYTKTELPVRLAGLWMSMNLCNIVSGFLAYGTLHLDGVAGKAGWRWLFFIEGLITFVIGITCFFNMPPSPTQTRAWFRPNGWFTEREEVIIVNKILRDDPTKGDMHNREGLTLKALWNAICNYDLWPVYILFSTFNTSLLTIPSQVIGILATFLFALLSELVGERTFMSMMGDVWVLPFLVALYALPSSPSPWLFFGLLTGLLSYPRTLPILAGLCSTNSGAVASRTVNATLFNIFVEASFAVSTPIYVAKDAPRYERGNRILIIICLTNMILLYPATKAYYLWRNRQRAKIWDAMTPEAKVHYLNTTTDVGNGRLDFRFVH